MSLKNSLHNWSILNKEAIQIHDTILSTWQDMLSSKLKEEKYHKFISDHSGFFFSPFNNVFFTISKLRMGADFIPDLIIPRDNYSLGLQYELVEFETPHTPPFTKKGIPSSRLSESIQQIQNWRSWIKENREEAKKLFPSYGIRLHNKPNFNFTIYIGTRKNSAQWLDRRNELAKQLNIQIRSFDYLTNLLRHRFFSNYEGTGSSEDSNLSSYESNQLANPFYCAFTDKEWRNLLNSGIRLRHHFICWAASQIINMRRLNRYYYIFINKYNTDL